MLEENESLQHFDRPSLSDSPLSCLVVWPGKGKFERVNGEGKELREREGGGGGGGTSKCLPRNEVEH